MLSRLFPSLFPSKSDDEIVISGSVSPGFEPVREAFEENFRKGLEANAQCCAYVGNEKVNLLRIYIFPQYLRMYDPIASKR